MTGTAPLFDRHVGEPVAWLSEPLACFAQAPGIVDAQRFHDHVCRLSRALPDGEHVINLCDNRYLFLVTLCAAVLRGQTNLLPSNKNIATQQRLHERYANTCIVHDGVVEIAQLPSFDLSSANRFVDDLGPEQTAKVLQEIPQIDLQQIAAISFTSGSTGDARPNVKSWRTLVDSTAINKIYMLPNQEETFYHLATVPGQHMWGFETSVLMALFAKVCIVDARPLYPHDIHALLKRIPSPSALISTPFHLRALHATVQELPPIANVLSATAPLTRELAAAVEAHFDTQVREIYGCSEVGSMAVRRTSKTDLWERFDGLNFAADASGAVVVSATHLPADVQLEDRIEMLDDRHFRLHGRATDQINIAGKRGSLHEVNIVLSTFPGLLDGIVFFPPQERAVPRLVALVVFADTVDKKALRNHFRKYLDAAFVPRPIIQVPSLPREENGKLVKEKLWQFYKSQLKQD